MDYRFPKSATLVASHKKISEIESFICKTYARAVNDF